MRGAKLKKIIVTFISIILFLSGCSGCQYGLLHPIRHDGPYKGKIIDADTGQPIEGVVVLGTWSKIYPNIAGATHEFYDASEAVTDKNGEFLIRGLGLKLISNVEAMNVLIFKAGYEHIGTCMWVSLKVDPILNKKVKWEGERAIVPLRKLTLEERNKRGVPDYIPSEAPKEKIILMLKEINKENKDLGLEPIDIWQGERI